MMAPWLQRGRWSPQDAAEELQRRRGELIGQLRRRSEGRGIPVVAQQEIVDDAITAVVMSPRGVANEHHLLGAFWLAVDHRCRRYREGRHLTRLGSRRRVEFDLTSEQVAAGENPFEALELMDRLARAADLMADLDSHERQVVCVMASRGVGPVSAARLLGLPLGEVRSAARSAEAKLDRIAAIYAAGRMCQFRAAAITADAAGGGTEREARLARAHVSACVPCGRTYRRLRREMRSREFQRTAVAAFLPLPVLSTSHLGAAAKVAVWIEERIGFLPRGAGGRTAEVLGGTGIVKAAATGTAMVAAGGALTGHLVHAIEAAPSHRPATSRSHHRASSAPSAAQPLAASQVRSSSTVQLSRLRASARGALPAPPSRSLGYLALGSGTSTSQGGPVSRKHSARTASASGPSTRSHRAPASSQTTASGASAGGTSLSYLGS
jgi:DNA-directed RNA polymerase specialized sigma24 family protein